MARLLKLCLVLGAVHGGTGPEIKQVILLILYKLLLVPSLFEPDLREELVLKTR